MCQRDDGRASVHYQKKEKNSRVELSDGVLLQRANCLSAFRVDLLGQG